MGDETRRRKEWSLGYWALSSRNQAAIFSHDLRCKSCSSWESTAQDTYPHWQFFKLEGGCWSPWPVNSAKGTNGGFLKDEVLCPLTSREVASTAEVEEGWLLQQRSYFFLCYL